MVSVEPIIIVNRGTTVLAILYHWQEMLISIKLNVDITNHWQEETMF
jgi:hypothetical protein